MDRLTKASADDAITMAKQIIELRKDKECKGSNRFAAENAMDGNEAAAASVYVKKAWVKNAEAVRVTIETID